ncbi:MAG: hypothetical protein K1X28_10160 [Parachlamydiales bacterium]|nr:hypothetical protein [Parachlamydiales bacterium]
MISSSVKLRKSNVYCKLIFVIIFLSGCFREDYKVDLSAEEKAAIEPLFRYLLFDNHGVFVLFGSKPICDALLPPRLNREEAQRMLEEMPEDLRQKMHLIEMSGDLNQAWDTWARIQPRLHLKKFILTKVSDSIYLIHIRKTVEVLKNNYLLFENLFGNGFSPEHVVYELQDAHSVFWEKLSQNHMALGLLYGFGKDNIEIFERNLASEVDPQFSTQERIDIFQATPNHFSIPIFVSRPNHPLIHTFENEKLEIVQRYKNKDMLTVSLKMLCD